jgi:hypothetical protein
MLSFFRCRVNRKLPATISGLGHSRRNREDPGMVLHIPQSEVPCFNLLGTKGVSIAGEGAPAPRLLDEACTSAVS